MRRPTNIYIARGPDGLDDVLAKLRSGPLAVDTETTGLDWHVDRVGSIQVAAGTTALFVCGGALAPFTRWLSRQIRDQRELVFHHAKFDLHMLRSTFGLHVPYPVHDTMLESFLLDNRGVGTANLPNHHLKGLARVFVDPLASEPEKEMMQAIRQAGGKHKGDWMLLMGTEHEHYVTRYSALDPWYTLQLHLQFIERIRYWPQPEGDYPPLAKLYETERWLTLALRDMEARGIKARRRFLEEWQRKLEQEQRASLARLVQMAGREVNWNSTPQLRALLYNARSNGGLGLSTDKRTGTNEASTGKAALVKLAHPIGAELLNYRQISKQLGGYATNLLDAMWDDQTIHCDFNQNVDTNRMSCRQPNLQQQTRESGVRRAYRPRKGLELRFADYSQIEMRYAAHYANDPTLIKGFNDDPDFDTHAATACRMFGVKTPTKQQRDYGKTMNFAQLYGAGEDRVTEQLMARMTVDDAERACRELGHRVGLAESPHRSLAKLLKARYQKHMAAMTRCSHEEAAICEQRGFSITAYGYHRYIDPEYSYTAFNSKIQGSAAGKAKEGMVAVYRELQLGTGELALLVQVHDEIIYESTGDPRTDRRVLELLQDTTRFRIPIIADMKGSKVSWQDKTAVKL
jgi:DNA polymerase-1